MTEPLIERDEVVALLFNVADIAVAAYSIERSWAERTTMAKKKRTRAEREEFQQRYERALANAQRTRELAERAQAKLDADRSGR
ncbi:MAG TPA: hypothetical protein VE220_07235 [Gaiellaceae bacterium]|nr:hypothetical protein [Gaiellaceae bacterium]